MRSSSIVAGIILIAVGAFFLALPLFPNIAGFVDISLQWPLIIVAVGFLFIIGAMAGAPGLAIPGSIIAGTGGILYYQNITGAWWSWAFLWTLYPGMVGIGIIISETRQGHGRKGVRSGSRLILISLILFLVFGFITGAGFTAGIFLALMLIALGMWVLVRTLFGRSKHGRSLTRQDES